MLSIEYDLYQGYKETSVKVRAITTTHLANLRVGDKVEMPATVALVFVK